MIRIHSHEVAITESDIDLMGHVNNVSYVSWMQEAAIAHSSVNGWTWQKYRELGAAFVAREHHIEYLAPAFASDKVHIETWVSGMKKVSSIRRYEFFRTLTRERLATAFTKWAFVDLAKQAPIRIPAQVLDCFEVIQSSSSD